MFKMKFTDIGEGLHEGTVAEVFVTEGQEVKEGDSLFSVETDKMTSEIPAAVTGRIAKVLIQPGQEITVGEEIFHIEEK
ncbi:biotin/lipoyl-binding protein [Mycoplasma sp. CH-Wi4]|uniref:Biotin/lipoyl-binding protein n=1 Tax=Mycoplasma tauri TaxID=547987 RepID=A0A953NDL8_9MOLU|nr:biotin/lipoyl-containing protein [Mycoplasma tauri]MBZ4195559.1 biotin/lipoyl-binding protein [Mycoplasma tauri]MBZ4203496.1 biotin/lipoyl-binding protein [Mycoplasma tauri]MBZ4204132.1 biotin/lipoyl-binding protein [Mycoplasma tauri]MBZ4212466.1 biotin/lipoyl-binding protein [Mycoplasma tauri]MBZ4218107.1 biotin/lipoyl-binding protein [Mycoplasma tauri]